MSKQILIPGNFCWIDFATPNPDRLKVFYQKVFHWKYNDNPMPEGDVYTMISTADGGSVGGLFQMPDEMKKTGASPHISNYIAVDNADDIAKKAHDLGATIRMAPFDVIDYGRMAVLIDPTGASFSIWQCKPSNYDSEMAQREAHGMFCWQELMTTDVDKAAQFYQHLFGWELNTSNMDGIDYTMIKNQDNEIGGIMSLPAEMKGASSHWNTYFTVTDIDETIKVIKDNGGDVMMGPQAIPETGLFACCKAPDGTVFYSFQNLGNEHKE